MKWTDEQREAITSNKNEILVSASAGSGKTTVMISRIVDILAAGSSELSELLVLTFTRESARDIREKLKNRCEGEIESTTDEERKSRLRRALLDLPSASIGTFHGFCADILRMYFAVVGIVPGFAVLDETDADKIKCEIATDIISENYQFAKQAVDMFVASRRIDALRDLIIKFSNFLDNREDPNDWLTNTATMCYMDGKIDNNPAVLALLEHYKKLAAKIKQKVIDLNYNTKQVRELLEIADIIGQCDGYDDFHNFSKMPDLARIVTDKNAPQYAEFKELRDIFKKELYNEIRNNFRKDKKQVEADIKKAKTILEGIILLVKAFIRKYEDKKTEYKKMDYADLEKYALKVFGSAEALSAIRERYKYIFVDEGQDTNPVQAEIVTNLLGQDKFFFMVGDVKQSIYGFRGCEPEMFENMTRRVSDKEQEQIADNFSRLLRLNHNYRSSPEILQFVNSVFLAAMPDYDKSKFVVGDTGTPDNIKIEILNTKKQSDKKDDEKKTLPVYDIMTMKETDEKIKSIDSQMELVYRHITDILKKDKSLRYEDVAVLSESGTHFTKLGKYLSERGVPCVVTKDEDAFGLPEIATLNNFLFAVTNPTNDLMLVLTMLNPVFNFTNDNVAKIKVSGGTGEHSFWDLIQKYIAGNGDKALKDKLINFNEVLNKYNAIVRDKTVGETLGMFIAEYDYPRTNNVSAFLNKIKNMAVADTVARYLYLCEHNLLKLEIATGGTNEKAVHIMTMHKSKGLEFPVVILFNMGDLWSHQGGGQRGMLSIDKKIGLCLMSADTDSYVRSSNIITKGAEKLMEQNRLAEKMRLLYVAMTRPKKYLYVLGTVSGELKERDIEDSKCMLDVIYKGIKISPYKPKIVDVSDVETTICSESVKSVSTIKNDIAALPAVKSDILVKQSVTSLTASEREQEEYVAPLLFSNIDRGGAEYGTGFHTKMQYNDTTDKDVVEAMKIINNFVAGFTVYKELPFLTTVVHDGHNILVQGIIDLLAVKDNRVIIIDYKTTRGNEERLLEIYTPQLKMYADAVARFLPNHNIETYIYSTRLKKVIKI